MEGSGDKSAFFVQNTWILYGIGTSAALARICIRYHITRAIGVEEVIMFFSLLCWTGDTVLIVKTVENGTNQVPDSIRASLTPEEIRLREIGSQSFVAAWFLYVTMIWGCKSCILCFYGKLTDRLKQRQAVEWMKYILGLTYVACILSILLVCRPFHHNWQVIPDPGTACTDGVHYVWIVGILNIVTDIILLAIPLPMAIRLRVNLTRKILVVGLFSLGIFVIIATILRIYFTIIGGQISNMTFWSMIETCCGMVVANAPGIKSLFTRRKPSGSSHTISGSYELSTSKNRAVITTEVNAGDSQERIVDPENPMVIHTNLTYDVVEHRITPEESNSAYRVAQYSADAVARN